MGPGTHKRITISGNIVSNNPGAGDGAYGISVDGRIGLAQEITIQNNTCRDNRLRGINLDTVTNYTVSGNRSFDTRAGGSKLQLWGLHIDDTSHGLIVGNDFRGNATTGTNTFASTSVDLTDDDFDVSTHAFAAYYDNKPVQISTTGTLPSGFALDTTYYAKSVDANNFGLSLLPGGELIDPVSQGSGSHTVTALRGVWSTSSGNLQIRAHNNVPEGNGSFDTNVPMSPNLYSIDNVLTATQYISVASVAAQASEDETPFTVSGAEVGDTVTLGVPSAAMIANVSWVAWVSAVHEVTVRCINVGVGATASIPGASFTIHVWKNN